MTILSDYMPVTRHRPCPICDRIKWCLVGRDTPTDPSRVICTKVESAVKWGAAGFLHVLRDDGRGDRRPRIRQHEPFPVRIPALEGLHRYAVAQLSEKLLHTISARLCVSEQSLTRLEMGSLGPIDQEPHELHGLGGVSTFPMRSPEGGVVGLRLRTTVGHKLCITGSRNGLFIPNGLSTPLIQLLIAEGESDAAALLDLGYDVIGRPGSGGEGLIIRFARCSRVRDVVVVMDGDDAGRRYGIALAKRLRAHVPVVRAIEPPTGIKDARAWKLSGATRADIDAEIAATKRVLITVDERRPEVMS